MFEGGKEHFLLGIKGQLNKKEHEKFVHTNIDCDVVVSDDTFFQGSEEASAFVPTEILKIMSRLCLGRRKLFF